MHVITQCLLNAGKDLQIAVFDVPFLQNIVDVNLIWEHIMWYVSLRMIQIQLTILWRYVRIVT